MLQLGLNDAAEEHLTSALRNNHFLAVTCRKYFVLVDSYKVTGIFRYSAGEKFFRIGLGPAQIE